MSTLTVPATLTGSYTIDPAHSRIGFVARHAMVTKVRGSFNDFDGAGYFDAANPANSKLQLSIKAASIDTRHPDRDAHLRSNDFFDMDTYPRITFSSTSVEQAGDVRFRVNGDLTIKGVTRPVTVDFDYTGSAVDPYGNQRIGFEGTTVVNRKDWGVNWNAALEAGGVLPRDHWGAYEHSAPIDHLDLAGEVQRWSGVATAGQITAEPATTSHPETVRS